MMDISDKVKTWHSITKVTVIFVIHVAVLLLLMRWFLV